MFYYTAVPLFFTTIGKDKEEKQKAAPPTVTQTVSSFAELTSQFISHLHPVTCFMLFFWDNRSVVSKDVLQIHPSGQAAVR